MQRVVLAVYNILSDHKNKLESLLLCIAFESRKLAQWLVRNSEVMTGKWCFICGNSHSKDPHTSFHQFPSEQGKRTTWLAVFGLEESAVKPYHRIGSRHFPGGDARQSDFHKAQKDQHQEYQRE